jgi:hypothetical protein
MSLEEIKKEAISFFEEAIKKWNALLGLCVDIAEEVDNNQSKQLEKNLIEASKILVWFQNNYLRYKKYSDFDIIQTNKDGKSIERDPIFNVAFGGANIINIIRNRNEYADDINCGCAILRGHLSSVLELKKVPGEADKAPILRVRKILSRVNLVENQLKRTRKDRTPFELNDEYDIQNLVHSLLKIDFNDVRKEDVAPTCAGASSRIDLVLKDEKILIEVKKTSATNREKEIGNQLIEDITRYKDYPNASILVCFIYDPEHWVENPEGLINDLEKQSTQQLNVEVIICPKTQ